MTQERLFTPGPTPIPPSVLDVLSKPIIHHRTGEFQTILARVTAGLMRLFKTSQPVLTLSASGTGGMEALVVNLSSPGDTVAVLNAGKFGERWGKIARAYELKVVELAKRWGESFTPEDLAAFLEGDAAEADVVFMTHSETSTGALNDLEAIAKVCRDHGKMVVADVVTSLGVHPMEFDSWGVGAAVAGAQKGLMLPPGAAFVVMSEPAWERSKVSTLPRYTLDLESARANLNKNSTPFTPPVNLVRALEESLKIMEQEGLDNVYARHLRHAQGCRAAVAAWGLELFADQPSNGLTAVRALEDRDGQQVVSTLRESYGFRIAGGQAPMKGKLFRLGHMGHYSNQDVLDLLEATDKVLKELEWTDSSGMAAAEKALRSPVS